MFPSLTVAENLELAGWTHRRRDPGVKHRTEAALVAFPPLRKRLREHAANLSGGEQQMLVLAMASVSHPAVLLIDELSLGLAPIVVEQLMGYLDQIHADGTTVVVVEQAIGAAQKITESAVFLERGRVAFVGRHPICSTGPTSRARSTSSTPATSSVHCLVPVVVSVQSMSRPGRSWPTGSRFTMAGCARLAAVDLEVVTGEIVGVIGPNGAGKSTLLDALCGLLSVNSGRVWLAGHDITSASFSRRARHGLGRSFQHAELFGSLTVTETLAIACDRSLEAVGVADAVLRTPAHRKSEGGVRVQVDGLIEQFGLTDQRELRISDLSTGQRRVVDLAAVFAHRPDVVLLDEPSSGLAQAEVAALGPLLRRIHTQLGAAMIIVEHDIPLVSLLADRLVVLDQGRVIAAGPPDAVLADPLVISTYLGTSPPGREPPVAVPVPNG